MFLNSMPGWFVPWIIRESTVNQNWYACGVTKLFQLFLPVKITFLLLLVHKLHPCRGLRGLLWTESESDYPDCPWGLRPLGWPCVRTGIDLSDNEQKSHWIQHEFCTHDPHRAWDPLSCTFLWAFRLQLRSALLWLTHLPHASWLTCMEDIHLQFGFFLASLYPWQHVCSRYV